MKLFIAAVFTAAVSLAVAPKAFATLEVTCKDLAASEKNACLGNCITDWT